jgi:hypothetical protein
VTCRLSRARSPGGTTLEEVVSERARDASTTAPNHSIGGFFWWRACGYLSRLVGYDTIGIESLGARNSTEAVAETGVNLSSSRQCEWAFLLSVVPAKMPMGILVG